MSRQRILVAIVLWLVVVASVSALVWLVISHTGADLVASDQPVGTPRTGGTTPSRSPSTSPPGSPSATPSASPGESPSETPSGTPSPVRGTWQGSAGTIVAACAAAEIRLVSAQPADGFRAEAELEGRRLVVQFEGREDRSGTEVSVMAQCVSGVPDFTVVTEDD